MVGDEGGETKREEKEAREEREDMAGRGSTEWRWASSISTAVCATDCSQSAASSLAAFFAGVEGAARNMGGL
jgi:hypothetical protein